MLLPRPLWAACLIIGVQAQVMRPTTTFTTTERKTLPDHYVCKTVSCAPYDDWQPVNFTNSTEVCQSVQEEMGATGGFIKEAPQMCRILKNNGLVYDDCHEHFCDMYEKAQRRLIHTVDGIGSPLYYGGEHDQCRSLLDFNRSLCDTDYRDAEIFCDCLCPAMPLLHPITPFCEAEIFHFLLLGRRSPELVSTFHMTSLCADFMCKWFERIGNPNPVVEPDLPGGVPQSCFDFAIPFRKTQCEKMTITYVAETGGDIGYLPCPWVDPGPTLVDDVIECTDGSMHTINIREVDSWSACVSLNFRWRCPANYPVMCNSRGCDGLEDHCCTTSAERCDTGEERMCSPLLQADLPEWRGILTPTAAIGRITSTTEDPLVVFLAMTTTTPLPANIAERIQKAFPWVIGSLGLLGAVMSCVLCAVLYKEHFSAVAKTIIGGARLMKVIQMDPVEIYVPSQAPTDEKCRGPLPVTKKPHEIKKEREDEAASVALQEAVDAAYKRGFRGLVLYHGAPALAEEEPLFEAMVTVRERGIEGSGSNAVLVERGEKWLRTLFAERGLMQATAAARPELLVVGTSPQPAEGGIPWLCTLAGRQAEGQLQTDIWNKVELLAEAIKVAKAAEAQDSLIRVAGTLLAELKARTHELPADRCVLDPGGEGLKLLPRGQKRAMLQKTGEVYMYDPESMQAGDVDDDLPPREELGDCDVDDSRPVCAEWAKTRRCKAGRRCPWRHTIPQPGDTIRECILCKDNDR